MNRTEVQKLIDACRGDADLALAEFAPLAELIQSDPAVRRAWEKSRQFDARVRTVIRDESHVGVPVGLEDRLLASLELCESPSGVSRLVKELVEDKGEPVLSEPRDVIPAKPIEGGRTKDWAKSLIPLVSLAAVIVVSLILLRKDDPGLRNNAEVVAAAAEWTRQLDETAWQATGFPSDYPLPANLARRPARWQRIGASRSSNVVGYELTAGGAKAVLFITRTSQLPELPDEPPAAVYSTQGQEWSYAAWTRRSEAGSLVYVIGVSGGNGQYQKLMGGNGNVASVGPPNRISCLVRKV